MKVLSLLAEAKVAAPREMRNTTMVRNRADATTRRLRSGLPVISHFLYQAAVILGNCGKRNTIVYQRVNFSLTRRKAA
ncbi:hypothetical protein LZD57_22995 [Jiella sp. CBK1P-4]|uniref:Uncharacterized protein n=1 Tax=Jiella avicenniae TaxID=2907202 RepID=A0A9X1P5G0_9HYPH|nr:hypothetical protein [Jiella avicenniae]